jgi:transposase
MQPMSDYAQLQLHFVDHVQRRYEVIRPIVLIGNRTVDERAQETQLHPETVRDLSRRFRKQGLLGLFPEQTQVITPSRGKAVPQEIVVELTRLKALYDGFGYRELTRMIHHRFNYRINDKTVKKLWEQLPLPSQGELPLGGYWDDPDRHQARLQVIKLGSIWIPGSCAISRSLCPFGCLWVIE